MNKVELFPGIHSSALGFGCAPVMGSVGHKEARRAIDCALDCGINHFDLARSYGYGEAEKFFGNIIKEKRDNLIIASKFGIKPTRSARLLTPVKPLVRYLRKINSNQRPLEHKPNQSNRELNSFNVRVVINRDQMRKSLEKSLQALKTDYLDYYFVHDPLNSLTNIEELSNVALDLKREGKIRAWGLAFMVEKLPLHLKYLNYFDILQFNPSQQTEEDIILDLRKGKNNILFSPLKAGDPKITPKEKFKELKKKYHNSVFLSSMFKEQHIIENASFFQK